MATLNNDLLRELNRVISIYDIFDIYKARAYRKLIEDLQTRKVPSLRMQGHLEEYKRLGKIPTEYDYNFEAYQTFTKIIGVGPKTAKEWVDQGLVSLAGLRKAVADGKIELTTMQKYGLIYYDQLNRLIPRAKVREIGMWIISQLSSQQAEIVGSYRRMRDYSGDIDIVAIQPDISKLYDNNNVIILKAGKSKTMLLVLEASDVYQVDIQHAQSSNYATMLLYFTGSKAHNIAMRKQAIKLGYSLSEWGLYRGNKKIQCKTEKDVFDKLGMRYVEPWDRI